jgi:broad specificity phosphatase PhoE
MNLYLVRHTETNYNVAGLSNSKPEVDVHLTKKGSQQAKELAKIMQSIPLDVVYTSCLSRTFETARYIVDGRDIPVLKDARLNDLNMGFEGRLVNEYHAALAEATDKWTVKFNDGESMDDVLRRVDEFLGYLRGLAYSNVLIVSHATVLQLITARVTGTDVQELSEINIEQGSYSRATF